jgi:hypothetical protein
MGIALIQGMSATRKESEMEIMNRITEKLEDRYENPTNIEIDDDGRVTCDVDRMPNTDQAGNIFCGYVKEILSEQY